MADAIDDATILAWLDGELPAADAARVEAAVAADTELTALADAHRAVQICRMHRRAASDD